MKFAFVLVLASVCSIGSQPAEAGPNDISVVTVRDIDLVRTNANGTLVVRGSKLTCTRDCSAGIAEDALFIIAGESESCNLHAGQALLGQSGFRFTAVVTGDARDEYDANTNRIRIAAADVRSCAVQNVK